MSCLTRSSGDALVVVDEEEGRTAEAEVDEELGCGRESCMEDEIAG